MFSASEICCWISPHPFLFLLNAYLADSVLFFQLTLLSQLSSSLRHWIVPLGLKLTVEIFCNPLAPSHSPAHSVFAQAYHVLSSAWVCKTLPVKLCPSPSLWLYSLNCTVLQPMHSTVFLYHSLLPVLSFSVSSNFSLHSHYSKIGHILFCQIFLWYSIFSVIQLDIAFKHGCVLLHINCSFDVLE